MRTLKLNIKDSVFDKVVYFLQNLPKDEVVIIEDKVINDFQEEHLDVQLFSNHVASQIEDWRDVSEDTIRK